ncbi:MAG: hypothetical protein AAGJ83_13420 [Planctomycetota bacterium]
MRKDVKRSLLLWPLATSLVVIALCFLAIQGKGISARLLMDAGQSLILGDGTKRVPASDDPKISVRMTSSSVSADGIVASRNSESTDDLSRIRSWLDVPIEISSPASKGIPAPKLDSVSDLFGFDARLASDDSDWENGIEDNGEIDPSEAINFDDLVIQLDQELFSDADQGLDVPQPLKLDDAGVGFSVAETRLAERPTEEVERSRDASSMITLGDSKLESRPSVELGPISESISPSVQAGDLLGESPAQSTSKARSDKTAKEESDRSRRVAEPRGATWPSPQRLFEQLEILIQLARSEPVTQFGAPANYVSDLTIRSGDIVAWSEEVRRLLEELHQQRRLGDDVVGGVLDELTRLQRQGTVEAETVTSRSQRVAWLQASYSLEAPYLLVSTS